MGWGKESSRSRGLFRAYISPATHIPQEGYPNGRVWASSQDLTFQEKNMAPAKYTPRLKGWLFAEKVDGSEHTYAWGTLQCKMELGVKRGTTGQGLVIPMLPVLALNYKSPGI